MNLEEPQDTRNQRSRARKIRFARFAGILFLSVHRREAFLQDPQRDMQTMGLSSWEQNLLDNPSFLALLEYIEDINIRPAIDEQIGDG